MMFRLLALVLALTLATCSQAFIGVGPPASLVSRAPLVSSARAQTPVKATSTKLFAKKAEEASQYWEGDWVCADCGYIYDRDECGGLYFEQQPRGFICPQCRGPRRRYAKMVGDKVGVTLDGGDAPILVFSFLGLAATVAFAFWFESTGQ